MVQKGSTSLPIIVVPRINKAIVTQTQIKNDFSNFFINDALTPLSFTLEYKEVDGVVKTVFWNSSKSAESSLFFPVPDSLYENKEEWTIAVFWEISTEKNYVLKPFHLTVDDVHNR